MTQLDGMPSAWRDLVVPRLAADKLRRLEEFVAAERAAETVFPPEPQLFTALRLTPPEKVKVCLIGQDPYHDDGQAHGLAFSVPPQLKKLPPSLRNIFKELSSDLGSAAPVCGDLTHWAEEGVLLLNSVLTVRAHQAGSHRKRGWEEVTDAILAAVNAGPQPVVFILWGAFAEAKQSLIDPARHRVITSVHPSPLSAHRGFFGSRPFSRANALLRELGREPVDWRLAATEPRDEIQTELLFE